MKRFVRAAIPVLSAGLLLASSGVAMANSTSCHEIQAQLASGKSYAAVAKDLKVSQKRVARCDPNAKKHSMSKSSSGATTTK
jgi:hypothetical protein